MEESKIRVPIGSCILTKSLGNIVSEGISWFTNSKFSHSMPHLGDGLVVDSTMPNNRINRISHWFDNNTRVCILAPVTGLTKEEKRSFRKGGLAIVGESYDLLSFLGFLLHAKISDSTHFNCAEVTLACYQQAGLFRRSDGNLVSPQTFWEWYCAEAFTCLYYGKPDIGRYFDFEWEGYDAYD